MFDISVDESSVQLHLKALPAKLQERLTVAMNNLTDKLRAYIMENKLSGQVLNIKTGDLKASITKSVISSSTDITGTVFSSGHASIYGKIHEYGAVFSRRVTMAWGRPVKNPREVEFHYPERSFMRTGLSDQREDIIRELEQAVREGTA